MVQVLVAVELDRLWISWFRGFGALGSGVSKGLALGFSLVQRASDSRIAV